MRLHPYIRIAIAALAFHTGCVEEILFDTDAPPRTIVVDGRITTGNGPHYIYLSYLAPFGKQLRVPVGDAVVVLLDDAGGRHPYVPSPGEAGRYELHNLRGEVGRSYSLEIRLPDERLIRSRPERLPAGVPVDSLSFAVSYEETLLEPGSLVERWFVGVAVHTTLTPAAEGPFLRWEVDAAYSFTELFRGGLDLIETCYFTETLDPQRLRLYDGSGVDAARPVRLDVGRRQVNWAFDSRFYFNVYQSTLTESAYRYWSQIDKVSNRVGSIFDAPPAAVRGNLYFVDDDTEPVLGYFGASTIDTARLFTVRYDIAGAGAFLRPLCPTAPGDPPPPGYCYSCMQLPGASMVRPDYY